MRYIDMHCDSLMKTATSFDLDQTIYENSLAQVDIKRLKQGQCMLQFFAIFLLDDSYLHYVDGDPMDDDDYIMLLSTHLKEIIEPHSDEIGLVLSYTDLVENNTKNKLSALLTIEDGRSINHDLDKLDHYFQLGVRLIGLTWNYPNCLGFPNSHRKEWMKQGLTPFGKSCIEKMNDLGMLIDVSHLSDGGFYDVARLTKQPFVASHSNARKLTNHPRNLTDDMIRVLADQGGVIGLNFAPQFLHDQGHPHSKIEDMVNHLNHMKDVGGEDVVAIGSDFDGVEGIFEIDSPTDMKRLFEALDRAGWSMDQIEKLAYKNISAVLKEVM